MTHEDKLYRQFLIYHGACWVYPQVRDIEAAIRVAETLYAQVFYRDLTPPADLG
mgnify:CR=1 FL=1